MPDNWSDKNAIERFAWHLKKYFGRPSYSEEHPGYTRSFQSGAPGPMYDEQTALSIQDPRTYDIPFATPAGTTPGNPISEDTPGAAEPGMFGSYMSYFSNLVGGPASPSRRYVDGGGSASFANKANREGTDIAGIDGDPREATFGQLRDAFMYAARMMAKEEAERKIAEADAKIAGGRK